jgi:hypothetical protein
MRLQASQALAKWAHVEQWMWCEHECNSLLETIGVDVLMPRRTDETCGASRRVRLGRKANQMTGRPADPCAAHPSWFHPPRFFLSLVASVPILQRPCPVAVDGRGERKAGRATGLRPRSAAAKPHIALSFVGRPDWHLGSRNRCHGLRKRNTGVTPRAQVPYAVDPHRRHGATVRHLPSSASRVPRPWAPSDIDVAHPLGCRPHVLPSAAREGVNT